MAKKNAFNIPITTQRQRTNMNIVYAGKKQGLLPISFQDTSRVESDFETKQLKSCCKLSDWSERTHQWENSN